MWGGAQNWSKDRVVPGRANRASPSFTSPGPPPTPTMASLGFGGAGRRAAVSCGVLKSPLALVGAGRQAPGSCLHTQSNVLFHDCSGGPAPRCVNAPAGAVPTLCSHAQRSRGRGLRQGLGHLPRPTSLCLCPCRPHSHSTLPAEPVLGHAPQPALPPPSPHPTPGFR